MQRPVGHRMEGDVLGQGAHRLAADVDHDDRVHEVAGAELADQFLFLDVDRLRILLAAIDDGGDPGPSGAVRGRLPCQPDRASLPAG